MPNHPHIGPIEVMSLQQLHKEAPVAMKVIMTWVDNLDTYYMREDMKLAAIMNENPSESYVAIDTLAPYFEVDVWQRLEFTIPIHLMDRRELVRYQYN
jgi:hypothetical protein